MTRQIQVLQVDLVDLEVPSTTEGIRRSAPIASESLRFVGVQQRGRKKQIHMGLVRPTVLLLWKQSHLPLGVGRIVVQPIQRQPIMVRKPIKTRNFLNLFAVFLY
jgi:hypothetical protein